MKHSITAIVVGLSIMAVTTGSSLADYGTEKAWAKLIDGSGKDIGSVELEQGPHGVLINVNAIGIPPGKHGLHIHSHGECDPGDGFKSAAGHVGLIKGGHGLMNPEGPEAGDLPNIYAGADGVAQGEFFTTLVSLDGREGVELINPNGSSFIIHQMADDHITQPIGGAGPRIACGIIVAK